MYCWGFLCLNGTAWLVFSHGEENLAGFFICGCSYKIALIFRFLRLFFITGKRV